MSLQDNKQVLLQFLTAASTFLAAFFLHACKTEDVLPIAQITADSTSGNRIGEGKILRIRVKLNAPASSEFNVTFRSEGTATNGEDYRLPSQAIRIESGKDSGSIQIQILNDGKTEGDESLNLTFSATEKLDAIVPGMLALIISDIDSDQDHDLVPDASDLCPQDSGSPANGGCPPASGLLFNEVLYDPSNTGLDGDANGDGSYNQEFDSFVEIVNNSQIPADISGFSIWDADTTGNNGTLRFQFPEGTFLQAGKCALVFGGGAPTGTFGGAGIFVAQNGSSGLSLNNTLETILLKDKNGNILDRFNSYLLSGNPNESYTRSPDITGNFMQHGSAVSGVLFSPGTKLNGDSF